MGLLTALRVVAVVSVGLIAGIFSGYRAGVHYAIPYLYGPSLVQLQQIIHVHSVSFMLPLILTALLSSTLWLLMIRSQWRTAEFWLVAVSASAVAATATGTLAVMVPLETQLMTWNVASPPADHLQMWSPWERVNTLRAVFATGALVLEAVALSLKAPSGL